MSKEAYSSWLTVSEWETLHKAARPNTMSMSEFQKACQVGETTAFPRVALDKVLKQLQRFLTSRGHLKEASSKVYGRKQDVSDEIQKVTNLQLKMAVPIAPTVAFPGATLEANAAAAAAAAKSITAAALPPTATSSSSGAPLAAPKLLATLVPVPTKPKAGMTLSLKEASTLLATAQNAGVKGRGAVTHHQGGTAVSDVASALGLGGVKVASSPFVHYESPLLGMTSVKQLNVKTGQTHFFAEIPEEHQAAVFKRNKRVLLVPTTNLLGPTPWPTGKDIYAYVNNTGVSAVWKRNWPGTANRKLEISYLPLDITSLLKQDLQQQKIAFDCFAKDYHCRMHLVIASPRSEQEVSKALLAEALKDTTHDRLVYAMYTAINGGNGGGGNDEVLSGDESVSLKDPLSQLPVQIPVRGTNCRHLQPVDLCSALVVLHKGCFWNCPKCDQKLRMKDMVIDTVLYKQLQGQGPKGVASIKGVDFVRLDQTTNVWAVDERKHKDAVSLEDSDSDEDNEMDRTTTHQDDEYLRALAEMAVNAAANSEKAEARDSEGSSTVRVSSATLAPPRATLPHPTRIAIRPLALPLPTSASTAAAVASRGKRNRGTEDSPIEL